MFKDYQKLVFFDFETTGPDVSSDPNTECFPIELAILVTDCELNIIGTPLSTLINWDVFQTKFYKDNWNTFEATKVHGIELNNIIDNGILHNSLCVHPKDVILIPHIIKIYFEELKIGNRGNDELILVSDNPYFDFTLMKKLYNVETKNPIRFPFYYNCYSPMMLFKSIGMKIKSSKPHYVLNNVYNLYKSCVIAFDRLRKFDKE